jgi:hypothetical protein
VLSVGIGLVSSIGSNNPNKWLDTMLKGRGRWATYDRKEKISIDGEPKDETPVAGLH